MMNFAPIQEETTGKRENIRRFFLNAIRSGEWQPGSIVPTRFEIAEKFDCSRATADFVIQSLIEEKVLCSTRGKGTFVTSPEALSPIQAIATINCNPSYSWSSEIEEGLLHGLRSKIKNTRFTSKDIQELATWKSCKRHQALVFIMPHSEDALFLQEARTLKIPHLVLYRDPPESSFINIDHRAATRAMVAALKAEGRTKLAWVSRTESRYKTPEERYAGFLEGLLEHKLPFRLDWGGCYPVEEESDFFANLLSGNEKPDALILGQTPLEICLQHLRERGIEPGKELSIATMDEMEGSRHPFPILCAEKLTRATGETAAQILLESDLFRANGLVRQYLKPKILHL